jgi:amidohydrolase
MEKLYTAVDKNRQLILDAERQIWKTPETGYKEFKTNAYMIECFEKLGYTLQKPDDITGFCTVVDTGKAGPTILVLGELDSIICPGHKDADPVTGAVHSCGHNAQAATLLGIAAALKEDGVLDGMCGKIKLCAVPAEELLEIEYRSNLIKEGTIKYYGGKTEFMHRGYFDDVDIAFMVHTTAGDNYRVNLGSVGCIAKRIIYKGTAAHAGGSPWDGKNALYAATCGINAANAIRETFKEADVIRFHPIVTSGGAMVNAIPETATLESYVRGSTYEAIINANKRINQALIGAALSIGTNVEILDSPGYAPMYNNQDMVQLCKDAFALVAPEEEFVINSAIGSGSTDMGDLSCVMPAVHPYASGAVGTSHGSDYEIADAEAACVKNAKWQLTMLKLLLKDGASRAKQIKANFTPDFPSIKDYLNYVDSLISTGDRIEYNDNGAKIRL